jgi:23S rRNA (guanosine2251-2'-O)-methyltransferase
MIYGKKPVIEAVKSRPDDIAKVYILKTASGPDIKEIMELAGRRRVTYQFVDREKLDKLSAGRNHQGVVADILAKRYVEVEKIIEKGKNPSGSRVICLLDGITDPQNLGTLLRNAAYFGIIGVVTEKRNSVQLSDVVMKVSAGAGEFVSVARVSNIGFLIDRLKKEGYWIAGTVVGEGTDLAEADLPKPLAVILGSEGAGLSRLVKEKCDYLIKVSGASGGIIDSLNVGSASAIIFWKVGLKSLDATRR